MVRGSMAAALAAASLAGAAPGPYPAAEVVAGTLKAPPTPGFLSLVRHGQMGAVLLLGRWPSPAVVRRTTAALQQAACVRGEPLLIAADQEGGIVKRFPFASPELAPAAIGTTAEAQAQGSSTAAALRDLGVDVDLAPVVDTPTSAKSFLGTRAFSRSTATNAALGPAFAAGLQGGGVAATAKHFPGLGQAGANTDDRPVVVRAAAWKLKEGLVPFRRAIESGVQLVMVSSAVYPALDASGLPAVFSPALETDLLRTQLGFTGVAVTDALTAPAAARVPHAATRAVAAGADLLLFGNERASEDAFATLAADARAHPHLRSRLAESGARIRALKEWLAAHGGPSCG